MIFFIDFQTRLLVTHGMHYLKEMHHIVLMENGKIVAEGEFKKLLGENEKFGEYVKTDLSKVEDEENCEDTDTKTVK